MPLFFSIHLWWIGAWFQIRVPVWDSQSCDSRSIKGTNPRTSYLGLWTREAKKDETSRSGQIGDLTGHGPPKGSWGREIPLFQGNQGWWNIIIWPDQDSPRSSFFRYEHKDITNSKRKKNQRGMSWSWDVWNEKPRRNSPHHQRYWLSFKIDSPVANKNRTYILLGGEKFTHT